MVHVELTRTRDHEPVYRCRADGRGPAFLESNDLERVLAEARRRARELGVGVRVHPGRLEHREIAGDLPVDFTPDDLPDRWPPRSDRTPGFPPGPVWAVGADREHRGPSGIGPGTDQPGKGQEIDPEDAAGIIGGFLGEEDPSG